MQSFYMVLSEATLEHQPMVCGTRLGVRAVQQFGLSHHDCFRVTRATPRLEFIIHNLLVQPPIDGQLPNSAGRRRQVHPPEHPS